jgi:hypothetical protein
MTKPAPGQVFVFGSNLFGKHVGGAARFAYNYLGARWGVGEGRMGSCYALPTKLDFDRSLHLGEIAARVRNFVEHAKSEPEADFFVTRVGCVRAGYSDAEIAPLFRDAPANCDFPEEWRPYLE